MDRLTASKPFSTSFLLLVSIAVSGFCGCQGESATTQNNGPNSNGSTGKSVAAQAGETSKAISSTGLEKVGLDEILARNDLNEKAKVVFLARQKRGLKSLTKREVDRIIADSLIVEQRMEPFVSKIGNWDVPLPSQASSEPPSEFRYPAKAMTRLEFFKAGTDFNRIGIEHFLKQEIPGLDDKAKSTAAEYMHEVLDATQIENADEEWARLNKKGSGLGADYPALQKDPMFKVCYGIAAASDHDLKKCYILLSQALEEFTVQDYPTRCSIYAHRVITVFHWEGEPARQDNIRYAMRCVAIKYWLENDLRANPEEHPFVLDEVLAVMSVAVRINDWEMLNVLVDSIKKNEKLPPWLKAMLVGNYEFHLGYAWRGSGFADTVTDEGWEKLELYTRKAAVYFDKAYKINPYFPQAATELITISQLGFSEESEEHWFERAIEHDPGSMEAFEAITNALLPKWGGSNEEVFDLLKSHAVDDSNVPHANTDIAVSFLNSLYMIRQGNGLSKKEFGEFCKEDDRATIILNVIEHLIESDQETMMFGKIREKEYFLTLKALFATLTGKLPLADEAFQKLSKYNQDAVRMFQSTGASFATDRAYAYVATSEYQADAGDLKKLVGESYETRQKNWKEILPIAESLSENVSPANGGRFFKQLADQIKLERNFLQGEEVPLKFSDDFMMWNVRDSRQLTFVSPDEAIIDNRKHELVFLLESLIEMPGDKQIDLDITFPTIKDDSRNAGVRQPAPLTLVTHGYGDRGDGLSVGLVRNNVDSKNRFDARAPRKRKGKLLFGNVHFGSDFKFYGLHLPDAENHFTVRIAGKYLELYVNNEFICRTWSNAHTSIFSTLSLRIPSSGPTGRGELRVSNIRVKAWEGPPLALEDEKLIKYYEKRVKENPKDGWPEFWLAQAFHRAESHEQAIEHYQKSIALGIRKSHAAFYIGDAYDRMDDPVNADKWYQISVENAPDEYPEANKIYSRAGRTVPDSYPEDWSRFRLDWIEAMQAGDDLIAKDPGSSSLKQPRQVRTPATLAGMLKILIHQHDAAAGKWDFVVRTTQQTRDRAPEPFHDYFDKLIAAYQSKKVYKGTDEEVRLYLEVAGSTPLFRHYEDHLPPALREAYRDGMKVRSMITE
jgi:tetratricopeptide (TPR) repeat protein